MCSSSPPKAAVRAFVRPFARSRVVRSPSPLPSFARRRVHDRAPRLPPHGRASARSAAKFSGVILDTLRKLHAVGVAPAHLCLGQGLTTFEARVKRELKEAGYGKMTTNAADRTHASKVASMGVEAALGIRKNEAGEVVGMHGS